MSAALTQQDLLDPNVEIDADNPRPDAEITLDWLVGKGSRLSHVRNWDNNIATVYPAGTQCP